MRRLGALFGGSGSPWIRAGVDFVAISGVVVLVLGLPGLVDPSPAHVPLLVLPVLTVALLFVRGLYRPLMILRFTRSALVLASLATIVAVLALTSAIISRRGLDSRVWLEAWLFSTAALVVGRAALAQLQYSLRVRGYVGEPTLIVGAGRVATVVAERLLSQRGHGLRPVGLLTASGGEPAIAGLEVLGDLHQLREVVDRTGTTHVVVAFSPGGDANLAPLVRQCHELRLRVAIVPRLFEALSDRLSYQAVGGLPVLALDPVRPDGWEFHIKHAFDRVAAAAILLAFSPLLAVIAVVIRLTSPGPAIFRQQRVGRGGAVFTIFKFRTMSTMASEERQFVPRPGRAPGGVEGIDRRTRIGRVLRRTSLDELPQLLNVVRGEMSLVGPRPERPEFAALFAMELPRYHHREVVKPGITGWAQVHGLRGQTSLTDRLEWDNYYIDHWSLTLELRIVALTVRAALRKSE